MRRLRRGGSDRGATMMEFALVLPLLLLLAFGTAEMGLAWVTNNRVEGSTSTAARIAASSGSLAEADRSVLQSLKSSLPQEQLNRLDRVIIFKPTNVNGGVPAGCIKPVGDQPGRGAELVQHLCGSDVAGAIPADLGAADNFWVPTTAGTGWRTRLTTSGCGSARPMPPRPARSSMTSRSPRPRSTGSSRTSTVDQEHGDEHHTTTTRARFRGERGIAVIMTALCLLPLMAFAAFGVDLASFYSRASYLQKSADAAALAGTVWMPNLTKARQIACDSLLNNGIDGGDCGTGPFGVDDRPGVHRDLPPRHRHRPRRHPLLLPGLRQQQPSPHPHRRSRIQPPPPPRQPPQLLRRRHRPNTSPTTSTGTRSPGPPTTT